MHPGGAAEDEPSEHLRYWAYLAEFAQVADADELAMVAKVLRDPDPTMAEAAVVQHVDRRARDLHLGPAFESWAEAMTRATAGHLFRTIMLGQPWDPAALLGSSGWLQRKVAATPGHEALQLLADSGPGKRIRNSARASLKQQGST